MADQTIIERSGSSTGIIAGIVIVAIVVIGFLLVANNNGGGSRTIDLDVPAVTVDVTPDGA